MCERIRDLITETRRMLKLSIVILMVICLFPVNKAECSNHCEKGWFRFENNCYFFSEITTTFKEAMVSCSNIGGALLELQNKPEEDWLNLHSHIRGYHSGVWLGVTDVQIENHFVALSNGRKANYIHWAKQEPNNIAGQEHCALYWLSSKAWHDGSCSRKAHYVCKK